MMGVHFTYMDRQMLLHIAQIIPCTEAEGPGKRFALWFQGCPLRCPGCCNPEMLPFAGGQQLPLDKLVAQVQQAIQLGIQGITLLGGEPFAHAVEAVTLARESRQMGLSLMAFSGYTLEELLTRPEPEVHELLKLTDILVDGPYLRDLPDTRRRWIGSTNQRIHFLTDRYRADDPCWRQPNTLEIRVANGEVQINGFPAQQAVGLWKRMTLPTIATPQQGVSRP